MSLALFISALFASLTNLTHAERLTAPPAVFAADSLVVEKGARRLTLFREGRPLRIYFVALGRNPVGDKIRVGDGRTPEGVYRIESRNSQSKYYRALRISYPDVRHAQRARELGVSPGGDIMIHGLPNQKGWIGAKHTSVDWTDGCIAVTNREMEWIYKAVPDGTPVEIQA